MQQDHAKSLLAKIAQYKLRLVETANSRSRMMLEVLIVLAERELAVHVRNAAAVKPVEAYAAQQRRPDEKVAKKSVADAPLAPGSKPSPFNPIVES
jgi:hypothetical protein